MPHFSVHSVSSFSSINLIKYDKTYKNCDLYKVLTIFLPYVKIRRSAPCKPFFPQRRDAKLHIHKNNTQNISRFFLEAPVTRFTHLSPETHEYPLEQHRLSCGFSCHLQLVPGEVLDKCYPFRHGLRFTHYVTQSPMFVELSDNQHYHTSLIALYMKTHS